MHLEALFKALAGTLDMCLIKQKGLRMMEQLYTIINLNTNATDLYMNPRCGYKSWILIQILDILIQIVDADINLTCLKQNPRL